MGVSRRARKGNRPASPHELHRLDVLLPHWRWMRACAAIPPPPREFSTAMASVLPTSSLSSDSLEEVQGIGVPTTRRQRRSRGCRAPDGP
jgi:hypothetical protein